MSPADASGAAPEPVMLWEARGHIRIMTFNRPEQMNAVTIEMEEEYARRLAEFRDDDDAWVLIWTGNGRAFSAGMDLASFHQASARKGRPRTLTGEDPIMTWKPIIAAIGGYAVGTGCEIAMACDIRIAGDDARMGLPEVKRGLIAGAGGCARMPRTIGLGNALYLMLTGDWVDAQECLRMGLVQKVVPRAELMSTAIALAEKICENGPLAVRGSKEAATRGLQMSLAEALWVERQWAIRIRGTEDSREGALAFKEKRKPNFKGQ